MKITDWNELFLASVANSNLSPTVTARALQIAHTAIFDAWAAFDPAAVGVHSRLEAQIALIAPERMIAAMEEAIAYAAYTAANAVFPTQRTAIKAFMIAQGYNPESPTGVPTEAAGIGIAAARAVLDYRATDFSNAANAFADTTGYVPVNSANPTAPNAPGGPDFDPNSWQPLRVPTGTHVRLRISPDNSIQAEPVVVNDVPGSFRTQSALTPQFGEVKAFSLQANYEFRPPAPPKLGDSSAYSDGTGKLTTGDAAYREQLAEVIAITAGLTDERKAIAEFWADGPRTETPPGHWNQLAQDVSVRDGNTLAQDVKMFFALNNALLDAAIATWETKYAYDSIRPISAIRDFHFGQEIQGWLGPDRGTGTILGQHWKPYQQATFVTPPFPEFTSGHSAFSMAAASILRSFTGSDAFYNGSGRGAHDFNKDGVQDFAGQYVMTGLAFEIYTGPPITLTWETFSEAAREAGVSRLYGGIHCQDGNLFGRGIGLDVGDRAWAASQNYIAGNAKALLQSAVGTASSDLLIGSNRAETFAAGAGNDTVRPNGGGDTVSVGAGSDRIEGYRASLSGMRVLDLGADDRIVILDDIVPALLNIRVGATETRIGTGIQDIVLEGSYSADRFQIGLVGGDTVITYLASSPSSAGVIV